MHGIYWKHLWLCFLCCEYLVLVLPRTRLTSFNQWTDYACSFINSDLSWRLPLFMQCVIGAILAGGSLLIPESPRYAGHLPA